MPRKPPPLTVESRPCQPGDPHYRTFEQATEMTAAIWEELIERALRASDTTEQTETEKKDEVA